MGIGSSSPTKSPSKSPAKVMQKIFHNGQMIKELELRHHKVVFVNHARLDGDNLILIGDNNVSTGAFCIMIGSHNLARGMYTQVYGRHNTLAGMEMEFIGDFTTIDSVRVVGSGNSCTVRGTSISLVGEKCILSAGSTMDCLECIPVDTAALLETKLEQLDFYQVLKHAPFDAPEDEDDDNDHEEDEEETDVAASPSLSKSRNNRDTAASFVRVLIETMKSGDTSKKPVIEISVPTPTKEGESSDIVTTPTSTSPMSVSDASTTPNDNLLMDKVASTRKRTYTSSSSSSSPPSKLKSNKGKRQIKRHKIVHDISPPDRSTAELIG